ncbi:MAG: excinuclease ABC subunit UvrA [Planctomycetes bacterium]|nr:excinuclease ABC subunit UvrA [Planctomycetota bacterium]
MVHENIVIRGAREHNLKGVDLTLPRDALITFTGVSGSGKSSLAFDTLFREGQRRFLESLSSYARQFVGRMEKPKVESITGLSPTLSIDQKTVNRNPRSTVATVTEIWDYLRLLFARLGTPHCVGCGRVLQAQTADQMADTLLRDHPGARCLVLAPVVRGRKGHYRTELEQWRRKGFVRARIDGELKRLDEPLTLARYETHTIELVTDRIVLDAEKRGRVAEALEGALRLCDGQASAWIERDGGKGQLVEFSGKLACPGCGLGLPEMEPRLFSFNSPHGACPECNGLGRSMRVDPKKVIPDAGKSIEGGALAIMTKTGYLPYLKLRMSALAQLGKKLGFRLDQPWRSLPEAAKRALLHGTDEAIRLKFEYQSATSGFTVKGEDHRALPGILPAMEETWRTSHPKHLEKFLTEMSCRGCAGARLRKEALAVTFREQPITHYAALTVDAAVAFFASDALLEKRDELVGAAILRELRGRLRFLTEVGLGYLTLDRSAATLSGGEAQRVRLATQVGAGLQGVLYVLDEPSIGLHPRDHHLLLRTLHELRDRRNTVCVVEHDRDTMLASDWLVDVGPGAGKRGGHVVASGPVAEVVAKGDSLTARYLRGEERLALPTTRRKGSGAKLRLEGARQFNLKGVDVELPLGCLIGVTGVSGSGKSTLVHLVLKRELARQLHGAVEPPGAFDKLTGVEAIDKVIEIDQAPIGRTPRSNPATYTGLFDLIRDLFAATPEAQARGWKKGRFSFNVAGGRCETCGGAGVRTIEMQFLADVEVTCEECSGRRFNRETLEVKWGGRDVHELLDASIGDAVGWFQNVPKVRRILQTLVDVGLDYMSLGQPSTTVSGGEAQRIKLAAELARPETGRTLYILDEPTTGLHVEDVKKLMAALHALVERGNTVLVIEHHLEVIAQCDWLLDLGPEGGGGGGKLVAAGTPEQIAKAKGSHTGRYLRDVLDPPPIGSDGATTPRYERATPHPDDDPRRLVVRGARKNNLRGIDVELPQDALTVITGVSGSGKTSLAFETLFAEGQRRFVESLSTYARRFFSRLERAPVDRIHGLRPAIAIDQKGGSKNPRSTVATTTEIHDHLRLLWARIGLPHCPTCGAAARAWSATTAAADLVERGAGGKALLLAPLWRAEARRPLRFTRADELAAALPGLQADGYLRLLIDGVERRVDELAGAANAASNAAANAAPLAQREIALVIDRVRVEPGKRTRLAEALEEAFRKGGGLAGVQLEAADGTTTRLDWSTRPSCEKCGWYPEAELSPRHFSFNHQLGACPECLGLGRMRRSVEERVIVAPHKPLFGGALLTDFPGRLFTKKGGWHRSILEGAARELDVDLEVPFAKLPAKARAGLLRGVGVPERVTTTLATKNVQKSREYTFSARFRGILGEIEHWVREADEGKWWVAKLLKLTEEGSCPSCGGGRLKPEALAVTVGGQGLREVGRLTVGEALDFFAQLPKAGLSKAEQQIAAQPLQEVRGRLRFLVDVGLDYLTLERASATLSGGEAQRIRLATQLGSGLVGCMYVLDEPSIGLHPRDTGRLIETLQGLKKLGNTIIVVEHDEEMMRAADWIVDLGPGAGVHGGEVVASGPFAAIEACATSLTGAWLRGDAAIATPAERRKGSGKLLVRGATRHNLKGLDVALPLGTLTALTGVSGSGKSTLLMEVVRPAVEALLAGVKLPVAQAGCRAIDGLDQVKQLIVIDQSPIGTTPSSNPATYTKVFDPIRAVFAATEEARMKGFTPVRFSFNQGDGRCEACQGRGAVLVEMHFLSDVWTPCEACRGARYAAETLTVRYKGKNIAEVLQMEVEEALAFFASHPRIKRTLQVLQDVGLGYLKLGQSSTTLSGGEAQRVKLAAELARPSIGKTLYLLDEPTTGLHFADVQKLVAVFHRLVERGSSVLVIEHHLDVLKSADWIVDLGPDGGAAGGQLVVAGTPETVAACAASHTGRALAPLLRGRAARRTALPSEARA